MTASPRIWTQIHLGTPDPSIIIPATGRKGHFQDLLHGGSAMSITLVLVDSLLAMGRNYQEVGRTQEALRVLDRLAGFRQLPAEVAEEAQARLAEILLDRRQFHKARRHLTAALVHQPDCARYHYLMAIALESDDRADRHRAADHYRASLRLDPDQPDCLGDFGLLALRLGQTEEGVRCLYRAVELAPDDPEAVSRLVEGLQEEGRPEEARRALHAALFRNPRDRRVRKLWEDFQFDQLRREQERDRRHAFDLGGEAEGPNLLPFIRLAPGTAPGPRRVPRDPPSPPSPPHASRPAGLPNRRHA
jgi:tetratricopeptide (TPR) repeat protein